MSGALRKLRPWRNMGFRVAILAIAFTLVAVVISGSKPHVRADIDPFLLWMGVLWYLGVPVWFCIEWAMFKPSETYSKEDFQYSQGLARNFWIAAAAVIAFLIGIDLGSGSTDVAEHVKAARAAHSAARQLVATRYPLNRATARTTAPSPSAPRSR